MSLFNRYALWPLLFFCHFLAASLLAWHLLAQIDFGYAWGYQALDIHEHIQEMGPQNYYKDDFEQTNYAEHQRLFSEITRGIQNRGEGLAEIQYPLPNGTTETLLRPPEVVHLEDVARLVHHYYWAGSIAALLFAGLLFYCYRQALKPPPARKVLVILGIVLAVGALILWLLGPVTVFYWLHEYAFPADNPWFFYYQESLMTTLMKAPDLFGFIALLLLGALLPIWGASLALMVRVLAPSTAASPKRR